MVRMSPFDARRTQPVGEAIAACREEIELEQIVSVVGTGEAQRAVKTHALPHLVAAVMGPHPHDYENGHA